MDFYSGLSERLKELENQKTRILEEEKHIKAIIQLHKKPEQLRLLDESPIKVGTEHEDILLAIKKARKQGKRQLDCAIMIALTKPDGIVKATEERDLLIEAGIVKNSRSALSSIYSLLLDSGKFEKIDKGVFKLKDFPK